MAEFDPNKLRSTWISYDAPEFDIKGFPVIDKITKKVRKKRQVGQIDKFITELAARGVEMTLDIERTTPSEVILKIRTRTQKKDIDTITKLLFQMFGY
ncbi:hypothetical protein UFOVP1_26 [uncultured Caudovirales phage]|uniref:Uncharacterized protein n=1 Tax=uncultured Caudovirales phage TaxID=2100421 RepID=A0A6J5KHN7_9CAUD|nr:hypothetical protein UFOVP1_26 [uncultured Caudovirales phage]